MNWRQASDAYVLAGTAVGEARGEGVRGMQAVINVACDRAANPRWWGINIKTVCWHPYQFSCWNSADPNRAFLNSLTGQEPEFVEALALANEALAGRLENIVNGADSYYAAGTPEPAWAHGKEPCVVIGHHRFYRVELGQPPIVARPLPTDPPAWRAPWMQQPMSEADRLNQAQLDQLGGQDVDDVSAVS